MSTPNKAQILKLLRERDAAKRLAFVRQLPAHPRREASEPLVASENPAVVVEGLTALALEYCNGSDPTLGAPLAEALHERARELVETQPNHGLLATTLSGLAGAHLKALSLLGRCEELATTAEGYIALYREEPENLPSLKTLHIEALVSLERFDDAAKALRQVGDLLEHPIQGMELKRLWRRVESTVGSVLEVVSKQSTSPPSLPREPLLLALKHVLSVGGLDPAGVKTSLEGLEGHRSLDPNKPEDFADLGRLLKNGEELLTRGNPDSELAVAGRIRAASAIFVHGTPPREQILRSIEELTSALGWANQRGVRQLENDANWGLYLCHSRLRDSSNAADALIRLRRCLESRRSGISDPTERAGIFGDYRDLFPAMCEHLYKAGRTADLLEAIEASKGRAIADRLTLDASEIVPDSAIYACASRLPMLARQQAFHYVSYFLDEMCAYAVLVDKQGVLHMAPAIDLPQAGIRTAAREVDPNRWGQRKACNPREKIPAANHQLMPLVAWLGDLLDAKVLSQGDHVVFCPDDTLYNVPLHYLSFRNGILLQWFSTSKVHSAFLLDQALSHGDGRPPNAYVGFVVPARQDLGEPGAGQITQAFELPTKWLAKRMPGKVLAYEQATLEAALETDLKNRVVHFSAHGWFPTEGNPFSDSYLLLADGTGLPDKQAVATSTSLGGRLTPQAAFRSGLRATGSHISTMACVSGLAREGVAGDTLGLDWAFLNAGATSLLSSHWFVDATAAARFFELFYAKWLDGKQSRAQAVREATLELLDGDLSPSALQQWAPFSLTGDFR